MALFVGSFVMFLLTALALSIGIIFRGRSMHAGCRGAADPSACAARCTASPCPRRR